MLRNSPLHYLSSSGSNNYFFPLTILWVGCAVPLLVLLELVREAAIRWRDNWAGRSNMAYLTRRAVGAAYRPRHPLLRMASYPP